MFLGKSKPDVLKTHLKFIKLLGVILDQHLDWNEHLKLIEKQNLQMFWNHAQS